MTTRVGSQLGAIIPTSKGYPGLARLQLANPPVIPTHLYSVGLMRTSSGAQPQQESTTCATTERLLLPVMLMHLRRRDTHVGWQ